MKTPLAQLANVIRSKNAGPFHLTFDILFSNRRIFEHLKVSKQISKSRFAEIYGVRPDDVLWTVYEPAMAFKATIRRPIPSGDPRDTDIYGCQEHVPLLDWVVDVPPALLDRFP